MSRLQHDNVFEWKCPFQFEDRRFQKNYTASFFYLFTLMERDGLRQVPTTGDIIIEILNNSRGGILGEIEECANLGQIEVPDVIAKIHEATRRKSDEK